MTHRPRILLTFILLVVGLFALNVNPARAATVTAVQDGNWDDPATWDCNCVPADTDDVVVPTPYTVSNYGTITTAGTLTIGNGGTVSNYGTMTNTGTITNRFYLGNHNTLINQGVINNPSDMLNFGVITNNSVIVSDGSILNDDTIINNGTLTITGAITNDSAIVNNGVFINAYMENNGAITNYGRFLNNGLSRIQNFGMVTNICPGVFVGNPPEGNPLIDIPCGEDGSSPPQIVSDGRISANDSRAAIYVFPGQGIQVYAIRNDSVGWLAAYVPAGELDDCSPPPSENQLLASDATGKYRIYRLTTCEYQVEVGPFGADGKVEVTIFTLVAGTPSNVYYTEYFVIPPQ